MKRASVYLAAGAIMAVIAAAMLMPKPKAWIIPQTILARMNYAKSDLVYAPDWGPAEVVPIGSSSTTGLASSLWAPNISLNNKNQIVVRTPVCIPLVQSVESQGRWEVTYRWTKKTRPPLKRYMINFAYGIEYRGNGIGVSRICSAQESYPPSSSNPGES